MDIWVVSTFWLLWIMLCEHLWASFCVNDCFRFSLDVELLSPNGNFRLNCWRKLTFTVAASFYVPTGSIRHSSFSRSLATLCYYLFVWFFLMFIFNDPRLQDTLIYPELGRNIASQWCCICFLFVCWSQYAAVWCGTSVPRPGIEPLAAAVKAQVLTTRPPGKSQRTFVFVLFCHTHGTQKFPGQRLNLHHSSHVKSLTARPPGNSFFFLSFFFFFFLFWSPHGTWSSRARDQIWGAVVTYTAAEATPDPVPGQGLNLPPGAVEMLLMPLLHSGNTWFFGLCVCFLYQS